VLPVVTAYLFSFQKFWITIFPPYFCWALPMSEPDRVIHETWIARPVEEGPPRPPMFPLLGCLGMLLALVLLCVFPLLLWDLLGSALARLHLNETVASLAVVGILLGSFVNIPLQRIQRNEVQPVEWLAHLGVWGWTDRFRETRPDTLIALNVGGCVIPVSLAIWQVVYLLDQGGWPVFATLAMAAVNIAVCYRVALPIAGIGIAMPGFVSPLTSVALCWILLGPLANLCGVPQPVLEAARPSAAFIAGTLGPLIGADLLHLRDIRAVSVGMLSIGGAGTFDGIVLSGVLAALLV